jgi:hypothetical protein
VHLLRYSDFSSGVMRVGVLRRDTISAIPGVTSLAQLWRLSREDLNAAAIRRWLRPISYQNVPEELLPVELRDGDTTVPRRVDGDLVLPASPPGEPPAAS